MEHSKIDRRGASLERFVLALAGVVIVLLFAHALMSLRGITDFRFSWYAVIPGGGLISTITLLFLLNRRRARVNNLFWFTLFLGSIIIWGIGEFMQHLSASDTTVTFWRSISGAGGIFTPLMTFIVVAQRSHPDFMKNRILHWLALFVMTILFLYLMFGTNLIYDHTAEKVFHFYYGREIGVNYTGMCIYGFWVFALLVPIVAMCIRHFRRQTEPLARKQSKLFLIGVAIFSIGTFVNDYFLPLALAIENPPLGMLVITIMACLFVYGMLRYNLFVIDPATVAPNILKTMSESVIVTDTKYRILFSNRQSDVLLADPVRLNVGASLAGAFKESDWQNIKNSVEQNIDSGKPIVLEDIPIASKEQATTPYTNISVSQVTDDEGKAAGIVWVLNDITSLKEANDKLAHEKASVERKVTERTRELSQAQAQLLASVQSLPFGFALVNKSDEIALSNNILAKYVQREIPTDLNDSVRTLRDIADDFRPAIDLFDCIKTARSKHHAFERQIAFGPRFYRFVFVPVLAKDAHGKEEYVGTVLMMEDTTEAKALERSRDEFFSIASHELRTPLTAIRGNTAMALSYYKDQLEGDLHQLITDTHDASLRLINIVNDFLDVSRLEQGKISFQSKPFDIAKLCREVTREYDVTGSRRKLSLDVVADDTLPPALADENRTRQILINLLSNALKYTKEGGIKIAITQHEKMLFVAVSDTGRGIPVESQHLLFHKFQQAAENILTRDNTRSTGLGLYISRLMAEGMNGKLYLKETKVGKGSTFVLELPVAKDA